MVPGAKPLAAHGVGRRWCPVLDPLMPRAGENESAWCPVLGLLLPMQNKRDCW